MQNLPRWLLAIAPCASLAAQQDAETFDLSVQARTGERIVLVEATEQLLRVRLKDQDATIDNRLRYQRLFGIRVEDQTDDGGLVVRLAVLRVHGSVTMPMGREKRFDSADEKLKNDNRQMAGISTSVVRMLETAGLELRATVDRSGRAKGAFVAGPGAPKPDDPETARDVEKLEALVEAAFGRLPGKQVAVGATWPHVIRTDDPAMPTLRESEVRLAAVDDDAYRLVWSGTLKKNDRGSFDPATSAVVDGTIRGEQTLDRRSCVVVSAKTSAAADLTVPGSPGTKASMRVSSTLRRATPADIRELARLRGGGVLQAVEEARIAKAGSEVRVIAGAVRTFYAKNGRLPDKLEDLATRDEKGRSELEELPTDPWGNHYVLVEGDTPRAFRVRSNGPDGKPGTADDIDNASKQR
ncbi:MAG: type II secretion system protein GspG [Planctomycetota bacterium]